MKHVRFVLLANEGSINPLKGGEFQKARGVILVTMSDDVNSQDCRWQKAGNYFSTDFETEILQHDIIVSG